MLFVQFIVMKPKKFIQHHYVLITGTGEHKMKHFQCKYCRKKCAEHTSRMLIHLRICESAPEDVKTKAKQITHYLGSKNSPSALTINSAKCTSSIVTSGDKCDSNQSQFKEHSTIEKEPVKIDNYMFKFSPALQAECEISLAKAIYASGKIKKFSKKFFQYF